MSDKGFRVLVEGLDHPEGVAVGPDGTLYAGGEAGQVYRIDGDKATEVASTGGFLLGLTVDGDGLVYACDVGRRALLRVDPSDGTVDVFSSGTPDRAMVNPNWSVFDDEGNLYVTDSGSWKGNDGCIFRVRDGRTEVWSTASTAFPNGACLSADGDALLVLESVPGAMVRIPIDDPARREVVCEFPDDIPDGICLDTAGTAYVFCYRPDRVYTVTPDGDPSVFAEDPQGTLLAAPTNGVFIGEDRRTLVCGNLGRWHLSVCEVDTPGLPLRYPSLR